MYQKSIEVLQIKYVVLFNISTPEFNFKDPEGTITIGNKKYIPMGNDSYMCDGQIVPKDLVLRLQMAQFAPKTDEA